MSSILILLFLLQSFDSKPSVVDLQQQLVASHQSVEASGSHLPAHPQSGHLPIHQHQQQQQMSMREPKPYKCPHCIKSFANNSYLSQHMRIHLGLRPFGPCQYCGKKFTQLSHLQQHIRTHTGEKPYKCKYANCDKAFSQLSNLQSHSRCHQSDKPYKCNSCYKCFTDEAALLEHIPKHRESKHLKIHICIYCGKSYTQSLYLDKHMTKHADSKTYYNGEFTPDSFESLNQLGNLNQSLNQSLNQHLQHSEEFALRQFQMAAAAAQQQANATTTTAYAASTGVNYPAATATAATTMAANVVNQIGINNTALSHLNFFQRSFQRNFSDNVNNIGNHTTLRNNNNDRTTAGFNMITPLENIKHFNQNSAAAAATANFQNTQKYCLIKPCDTTETTVKEKNMEPVFEICCFLQYVICKSTITSTAT
uniref:C2H2-type domain-containing protein n=1 Tax=Ditylenchus dipsaci TaxID=166011 RepID=A0A915E2T5_9BILA